MGGGNMDANSDKIVSIASKSAIAQLKNPEFFDAHLTIAIDVSAIETRMGSRWARRAEQVWEHLERSLDRRLRGNEMRERVAATIMIVAMQRESRAEAIAIATHALQDTLHFFLGSAPLEDIRVSEVAGVHGEMVQCRALGASEIEQAAAAWTAKPPASSDGSPRRSPTVTIITSSGRALDVMISVESIQQLRTDRALVLRAAPHITDAGSHRRLTSLERQHLDFGDIAAIDAAVLGLARQLWEAESHGGPMVVPISFNTVSRNAARNKLLADAGIIADESRAILICEIIDIVKGTPTGRVREVLALTKAFCRGIFIETQDPTALRAELSGWPILGLTFDASDWADDLRTAPLKRLVAFAAAGKGYARSLIAHGLPSPQLLPMCKQAGLSHAAARSAPSSPVVHINGRAVAV